jgi:hypothetical protein
MAVAFLLAEGSGPDTSPIHGGGWEGAIQKTEIGTQKTDWSC